MRDVELKGAQLISDLTLDTPMYPTSEDYALEKRKVLELDFHHFTLYISRDFVEYLASNISISECHGFTA